MDEMMIQLLVQLRRDVYAMSRAGLAVAEGFADSGIGGEEVRLLLNECAEANAAFEASYAVALEWARGER